jgi:hypothetical protein
MTDLASEVQGLAKRFAERTALADLDLAVPCFSAIGILGPYTLQPLDTARGRQARRPSATRGVT